VAHEEFCGMGLSDVREFMDEGTVLENWKGWVVSSKDF